MSNTGLEIFDTTLHETNHWLKIVMGSLQTDDRRLAFTVLRATLHALRDRIGPANAVHLGAQLPMLLRGAFYERHVEDFLFHIDGNLPPNLQVDAEAAARASFCAMTECLDGGEVAKVIQLLPSEIRWLWPISANEIELALPL